VQTVLVEMMIDLVETTAMAKDQNSIVMIEVEIDLQEEKAEMVINLDSIKSLDLDVMI
jgi:hypothetical protein